MELISWLIVIQGLLSWKMFNVCGTGCERFNETNKFEWLKAEDDRNLKRFSKEWWTADCRVKNFPDVIVQLRQGDKLPGIQRIVDGRKLKNNGNIFNLTNITDSDVGMYHCTACKKSKKVTGIRIRTDGKPYQKPTIVDKPRGNIEYGAHKKMVCEVDGPYNMYWYKDVVMPGKELKSITTRIANYKKQCTLEIKDFSKEDEALYICQVTRPLVNWVATDKVRLTMKAITKPTFKNFPKRIITVKEGDNFSREIIAIGSPTPDVTCPEETQKNKKRISKGNYTISIIQLLHLRHNGTKFTCNATNVNGSTVKYFSLNVEVKPKINKDVNKTPVLKQDTALKLTCKIDQANPEATINWTYSASGEQKKTKWHSINQEQGDVQNNGETLLLKSQKSFEALYKCLAENKLGKDNLQWNVTKASDSTKVVQPVTAAETDVSTDAVDEGNSSQDEAILSYIIAIIVVSVSIALFWLFIVLVLYKRKKRFGGFYIFTLPPSPDYLKNVDQSKSLQEQSHKLPYLREWDFPRERITLLNELGSGSFGVVFLADAIGISSFNPRKSLRERQNQRCFTFVVFTRRNAYIFDQTVVKTAVKTLKANHNQNDLADLRSELKILIHIGEHENVVNILGACTEGGDGKPWIILEYCPHGNLREFLRRRRDIYNPEWEKIDNNQLSITDLINFGFQISKGMKFLISRKCIHRDLAARNVLVGEGYVAKISDFGLARNVYRNYEYVQQLSGILPLKWMAVEAIKDLVFNEKTDVWSYGIVLWEMFTLGGTPYPNIPPSKLLQRLVDGYRMDAPNYCPEQMADLMMSCWHKNPNERLRFSSIVEKLEVICKLKPELKAVREKLPSVDLDQDTSGVQITIC